MNTVTDRIDSPSPDSSENRVDELLWKAEEAMPDYESHGDWRLFNRLRLQLEEHAYVFVMAGPDVDKKLVRGLNVDFWSEKGIEYRHLYDFISRKYGFFLKSREICAAACLLENIHQHVKEGIGLCVIAVELGKYKRITVSDNGRGFYNYEKGKNLSVKKAIKFGRSYGKRYRSRGEALATSFGKWSDCATVETPHESTIILPEGILKKIMKTIFKIILCLIISAGADTVTLLFRQDISIFDFIFISAVFGITMTWSEIKLLLGKRVHKKYFPLINFRIKNRQEFGTSVTAYFYESRGLKKWKTQVIRRLKDHLQKRAGSFRLPAH